MSISSVNSLVTLFFYGEYDFMLSVCCCSGKPLSNQWQHFTLLSSERVMAEYSQPKFKQLREHWFPYVATEKRCLHQVSEFCLNKVKGTSLGPFYLHFFIFIAVKYTWLTFPIVTILTLHFCDIKYIHIILQPSPPSISRTFSPSQTKTLATEH